MPKVIAVSGPVGGGKTTFAGALAARLGDASLLFADSYERMTEKPAADIEEWIRRGADYNELIMVGLAEDLERLRRGQSVVDPLRQVEIVPRKYLVFETNFGREHAGSGAFIDLLIWIDLPLEIALARKVKQFTAMFLTKYPPEEHRDCLVWLDEWLVNYLRFIRDLLAMQKERVAARADLVVDGRAGLEAMLQTALGEIERRLP
jgi:adenylate kinase family enzyme